MSTFFNEFEALGAEMQEVQNLETGNVLGALEDAQAAQDFQQGNIAGGILDEFLGDLL